MIRLYLVGVCVTAGEFCVAAEVLAIGLFFIARSLALGVRVKIMRAAFLLASENVDNNNNQVSKVYMYVLS